MMFWNIPYLNCLFTKNNNFEIFPGVFCFIPFSLPYPTPVCNNNNNLNSEFGVPNSDSHLVAGHVDGRVHAVRHRPVIERCVVAQQVVKKIVTRPSLKKIKKLIIWGNSWFNGWNTRLTFVRSWVRIPIMETIFMNHSLGSKHGRKYVEMIVAWAVILQMGGWILRKCLAYTTLHVLEWNESLSAGWEKCPPKNYTYVRSDGFQCLYLLQLI